MMGHMSAKRAVPVAVFTVTVAGVGAAWALWLAAGQNLAGSVDSYLLPSSAMAVTFTGPAWPTPH